MRKSSSLLFFLICLWLSLYSSPSFAGHPFRGSVGWSVLLCNYLDSPAVPARSKSDVEDMWLHYGKGGLADFYSNVSRGAVKMDSTSVQGWFTIQMKVADVQGMDRNRSFQLCVDAARAGGYTPPTGNSIAVVTSPEVDLWGGGGRAFLSVDKELSAYAHEVSHGLGMNHSHSDSVSRPCGGDLTEYHDAFDTMSWACDTIGISTPRFGAGGPAFNAFHVDRMGWLLGEEIVVFGADGATDRTLLLTTLYRFGFGGIRLIRVPFDAADLNNYFTVELRMPTGWDAGFGEPKVLIHESRVFDGQHRSFLQRASTNGPPAQTLSRSGVFIQVASIDAAAGTAQIHIASEFATHCIFGFVWRGANAMDRVCVTGASRETVRVENSLADSRRSPNGGPFGPNTCLQGFVWRGANGSDQACVTGDARERVRRENSVGVNNVNPARVAFGPNTCRPGFVWRGADGRDWVCVSGQTRADTAEENRLGPSRRVGRTNLCIQGFVWREAYQPDDYTCVPGTSRERARTDNAAADSRRAEF